MRGFDVVRGAAVVSMVGFHLCYDLAYLKGSVGLAWFAPPLQDIWRASISWTFLLVAGAMCSYSRNNLRRAGRYLVVAIAIYVVTSMAGVDVPISFGIIYCMGISTLMAWVFRRVGLAPTTPRGCVIGAVLLAALFVLCLGVPSATFGLATFGGPALRLPHELYVSGHLSWLGFPGPNFSSGDYYPPLPFSLLFLVGACLGRHGRLTSTPKWLRVWHCRPLEWVGRHALEIYILHQPLLLVATGLLL